MNLKINRSAQAGFTLIELIVVIVILGILAATALPKFANLGGDARIASLNGVRGSLNSVAAMAHGRFLASATTAPSSVTMEDVTVTMNTTSGYPTAAATVLQAAGIVAGVDYAMIASTAGTAATATTPAVAANSIVAIPNSVAGTANAVSCFVQYTEPKTANAVPTIAVTSSTCGN